MGKEQELYGKYGTLAKVYLEEHEPAKYWALGKDLPEYLHGIDRQAGEMYDMMYAKLSARDEYKRRESISPTCARKTRCGRGSRKRYCPSLSM